MTSPARKSELRNGETIRAYLEELLRLKAQVQLWPALAGAEPFRTTLEQVSATAFSTTTTPPLARGKVLNLSFILDARRFVAHTEVVANGVFSIPFSIAQGERRGELRGAFDRLDRAEALVVEGIRGTLAGGRTLLGKVLDLSPHGFRLAVQESGCITGDPLPLQRGQTFDRICISNLPLTPPIHAAGVVAHVTPGPRGLSVGFLLDGLTREDQRNIERILARRFPASFGQAFPELRRRTDPADLPGTPTPTRSVAKAPEVVQQVPGPVTGATPARPPQAPGLTAAMRLRKPVRRILVLAAPGSTLTLAASLRADGFRQVTEAGSFLAAKHAALTTHFDLLILEGRGSGRWARDIVNALRGYGMLMGTPILMAVENRGEPMLAVAAELEACHLHDSGRPYEELAPVLYQLLLADRK